MASNSLLALLNLSSSGSSPSKKIESSLSSSSPPPPPPLPVVSPPPTASSSSTTANTLLQSILGPRSRSEFKSASSDQDVLSPGFSSPAPNSDQDNLAPAHSPSSSSLRKLNAPLNPQPTTVNDLLALLSDTGISKEKPEEDEGDTSFHEQTPRSRLQPIGTPPNQSSRKELSKSPIPSSTMFDTANLFDLLRQPQKPSINSSKGDTAPQVVQAMPRITQPSQPAYTIRRDLHASHHLSRLHASSGFEDVISNGLDIIEVDGVQNFTLDLKSPQPAGLTSLYPAKLEITPISLLTTTFNPSIFINAEDERSSLARWPSQRVAGMDGKLVMYVMSKGRIRVIDQASGDRILARADSTIRSVFTPGNQRANLLADEGRMLAAITEKGGLCVWLLEQGFGQSQEDAPTTLHLFADKDKTFVYAQWLPERENSTLLVVQSDGVVALVSLAAGQKEYKKNGAPLTWLQCPKQIVIEADDAEWRPVGISVSSDGSLIAIIEAGRSLIQDNLRLRLFSLFHTHTQSMQHATLLPSLAQLGCKNINFSTLINNDKEQMPRGLLLGFDDNQVIALIDLSTGSLKQLYRFNAPGSSFSLAAWHSATSSLIICCSIRSSIFSLRPRFAPLPSIKSTKIAKEIGLTESQAVDQSDEVLYRIKHQALPCSVLSSKPALRECALPEPYVSFALDDTTADQKSIRLIATHLGGIHAVQLPEEALSQSVIEVQQMSAQQDDAQDEIIKESQNEEEEIRAAAVKKEALPLQGKVNEVQNKRLTINVDEPKDQSTPIPTTAPAVPTVSTSERKKGSKHNEAKKKHLQIGLPSTSAKVDDMTVQEAGPSSLASGGVPQKTEADTAVHEDIKTRPASFENTATLETQEQSQAQTSFKDRSDTDNTQAVVDQMTSAMTSMVDNVMGPHLKVAVDVAVSRCLAEELHNALLRPDISNHIARSIIPSIQKTAMDVVSRVLAPHFESIMGDMATNIEANINMGLTGIRKDVITEQSKALLETDASLKDINTQLNAMTRSIGLLLLQNKKLEKALENVRAETAANEKQGSPLANGNSNHGLEAASTPVTTPLRQSFLGHTPATPSSLGAVSSGRHAPLLYSPGYAPTSAPYQNRQPSYYAAQPLSAPVPSFNQAPAPAPAPAHHHHHHHHPHLQQVPSQGSSVGMTSQEVEDDLLASLSLPNIELDATPLQSCLSRISSRCTNPMSALFDSNLANTSDLGRPRISQAVILTLLHRLIKSLRVSAEHQSSSSSNLLSVEFAVPWIEACAAAIDKDDEVISRYYHHIRTEMIDNLILCHHLFKSRAYWWTEERFTFGIMRFIQ